MCDTFALVVSHLENGWVSAWLGGWLDMDLDTWICIPNSFGLFQFWPSLSLELGYKLFQALSSHQEFIPLVRSEANPKSKEDLDVTFGV